MAFATYTLGRSKSADIQYDDPSVSRLHVEITSTVDGRLYLVDRDSTAGTYIWRNNDWVILKQGFVQNGDTLALGKLKIPVRDLLDRINRLQPPAASNWEPMSIKPKRSALTGEVQHN